MKSIYEFLFSEHLLKSKTGVSTQQDNDCVDFGLPSGLLWAKCNIGADEPTEYGDYFMWGSTEPNTNDDCDWEHCPFNNGSDGYDKDYFESIQNNIYPNNSLAPKYDAAAVILGDGWRLPTMNDFKELINTTKHEWVENYQDSKINGMIFEANGTELFIPASGYRNKISFYDKGSCVYMWSSSLCTSSPNCARNLYGNASSCSMSNSFRYYGFCLRAVKEK